VGCTRWLTLRRWMSYWASMANQLLRDNELRQALGAKVISGLDAARAVAVLLVLADHLWITDHLFGVHPALGPLGVTIFFVLSGFLITSLLLKEYRRTESISLAGFYRRRAYRIFPTFYACWMLTAIVELLTHSFDSLNRSAATASFFYYMDYWRAFGPADTHAHMYISWSLAIEEKFYLLWPLLLRFMLRGRLPLAKTTASIILGLWIYRAILFLWVGVSWKYMYYPFDTRADALLVGCLLSIIVETDTTRIMAGALLARKWFTLLPVAALLFTATFTPANRLALVAIWSIEPLLVAAMLLQLIYWGWKSWTFCSSSLVRVLARLSYALYLYHPLAGMIAASLRMPHIGVSTVALTVVLSVASYVFVERPFLRMRDTSGEKHARRVQEPATIN
jgi:peptidoglycan/LPS O-acetylase OafA/YrhL